MQPEFWQERWRTGQIGFHQSAPERNLARHWADLGLAKDSRVFVPLCGKSLDLLWLRERGHVVTGVELSATAVEAFCMENGIPARRRSIDRFDLYEAPSIDLLCGDFFALTPALLGPVAAVYDRAALISWTDGLRGPYVEHMTALTSPGTQTLLIALEYRQAQMAGPPFSVDRENIEHLYARHHDIQELARQDILEAEPRLRARGVTALFEVCYRLTRL
jgi:thiopurine S-methyltransferase